MVKATKTEEELVKLYFFHIPAAMILEGRIDYRNFPQHEYMELMRSYQKEYSETESSLMYQRIRSKSEWRWDRRESNSNVFLALVHVAEDLLVIDNNDIRCRYSRLQGWRNVTRYLGEDLLVCAYMARRLQNEGVGLDWFCWDIVLKHTNKQLNAVMSQGISENHFHLFGSAPVFQLVWIKLMNDVNIRQYIKELQGMDRNKRNQHTHFDKDYREDPVECMILQAALMRGLMYAYLNGKQDIFETGQTEGSGIRGCLDSLKQGERIMKQQPEIRSRINLLKAEAALSCGAGISDYALEAVRNARGLNGDFAGERKLVYEMLCDILVYKKLPAKIQELLYPYLVIRTAVRGTLVQNNDNLGFENFSVYSSQKRNILTKQKDIENMIKHAVLSSFEPGNLRSLEIRISPQDSCSEDARQIYDYDRMLAEGKTGSGILKKEQFYYVYHFAKKVYKEPEGDATRSCRDHGLRREILKKGNAILELRQRRPEAARLKGIDACSQEIGCRPEVFAPVFRQLRNQVVSLGEHQVPQLRITYHVGEDFLDLADGLRAIDEAVHFLSMRDGDRLGHATALGYRVETWYERKNGKIVLPAQDYLDNVAWVYNKLLEFQISDSQVLKDYLLKEYTTLFYQIYKEMESGTGMDIFTYYEAWKLRGDLPELYNTGRYNPGVTKYIQPFLTTPDYPKERSLREKDEVAQLYYQYHFNKRVREAGKQPVERQVPPMYVKAVEQIQREMQWQIAQRGIGIEANPSSNLAISSMESYRDHPIINLYNLGLRNMDQKDHDRCAQMFVSINTDDKGVFHTSLENEYALMASAVEQMVDENGRPVHSPQEVYDWLDRIRRMGNQQAFD